jgi:branched-chain amino acid transport system ATP-binding protein
MSLEVENIHTFYGLSHVLFGLSLSVEEGEIVSLLGRNGAGKTTTLCSIIGITPPKSGSIKYKGQELVGKRIYQIAREGVGYVPGDRRIFPELTVRENLEVGRRSKGKTVEWTLDRVYELFPLLKVLENRLGGHLSGGERQMLAIARPLMGNPELLLLDEPMEGLAPMVVQSLEDQILRLKESMNILLAEQNVKSALKISDRGYVIKKGKIFYHGTAEELQEDEEAKKHLTV